MGIEQMNFDSKISYILHIIEGWEDIGIQDPNISGKEVKFYFRAYLWPGQFEELGFTKEKAIPVRTSEPSDLTDVLSDFADLEHSWVDQLTQLPDSNWIDVFIYIYFTLLNDFGVKIKPVDKDNIKIIDKSIVYHYKGAITGKDVQDPRGINPLCVLQMILIMPEETFIEFIKKGAAFNGQKVSELFKSSRGEPPQVKILDASHKVWNLFDVSGPVAQK
jgi:hypothetical protein